MLAFLKYGAWCGVAVAMFGCVVVDDSDGDSANDSVADSMTPNPTSTSDGGASGESTASGPDCDPPCPAGQMCVEGTCFDDSNDDDGGGASSSGGVADDSTGEPPAECGLAIMFKFPNPECGPCIEGSCCPELQTCFGDETTMMETECLLLNNCIADNCPPGTLADAQACAERMCPDSVASFESWSAYQVCAGTNCQAQCS